MTPEQIEAKADAIIAEQEKASARYNKALKAEICPKCGAGAGCTRLAVKVREVEE